jgi:hypothetical protein
MLVAGSTLTPHKILASLRATADGHGAAASALPGARRLGLAAAVLLVLLGAAPAWGWTRTQTGREPLLQRLLLVHQGEHVVVLSISSIEWGTPDRWSFTSRCVYMFGSEYARNHARWINFVALTASPGLDGGRVGLGYQFIPCLRRHSELGVIGEARAVLLRTWGNPLVVSPNRTFAGAELRASLSGFLNAGAGWYGRVQGGEGGRDHFWGVHLGVGM